MNLLPGRRIRWAALGAIVGALTVGGIAWADIPYSGVINGCYATKDGALRVIDTSAGQSCDTKKENPLSWNQSGPTKLTCRAGMTLIVNVCIENASRAATLQFFAARTCAELGRRLPSGGELTVVQVSTSITLDSGENGRRTSPTTTTTARSTTSSSGRTVTVSPSQSIRSHTDVWLDPMSDERFDLAGGKSSRRV
jgi:hypothetical protein